MTEKTLIKDCLAFKRDAQKHLYNLYSEKMLGVCRRYTKNYEDAEDVMIAGFFKVFTKIHQYSNNGSFEGWIRRIMVNESLMFLRKKVHFADEVDLNNLPIAEKVTIIDELSAKDILKLLEQLPTGYRTVFNLYVIEGYKHREIAEQLGISINTSKSQLIQAKKRLKALVVASNDESHITNNKLKQP